MAKPILPSIEQKRKYALSVLSGAKTRKEAYLSFINPYCTQPTKAAARLHKTKQMRDILAEITEELNYKQQLEESSTRIMKKQLELTETLLHNIDLNDSKSCLSMLKSLKSIQESTTKTLERIEGRYRLDPYNTENHNPSAIRKQARAAQVIR